MQFKIMFLAIFFITSSFATCNYVVVDDDSISWQPDTRSIELAGLAVAPLCADLPEALKSNQYKAYCNNQSYNAAKTIYAPYDTASCYNLIGTKWGLVKTELSFGSHRIATEDLNDESTIILHYPRQFD